MEGEDDPEAGRADLGRLPAFSDGVFAIAITILVLGLDVPPGLSPEELGAHLEGLLPILGSAALSFAVIGRFWIAHSRDLPRPRVARTSADIAVVPAFFLISIPVAFPAPHLAPFCWIGAALPAGALWSRLRS